MQVSAFVRLGLFAVAAALPSWALVSTSTACIVPASGMFGQQINITAQVASADGGVSAGTITFFDGGTAIGAAALDAFGSARVAAAFSAGLHAISCSYSGDSSRASSISTVALLDVGAAPTTITVTASMNPVPVGQRLDLDIDVASMSGAPSGTATLMDGNTILAVLPLQANDNDSIAQYRTSTLAGGTHLITASYGGDPMFMPATTKQPLVLVVGRRSTTTVIRSVAPSPANPGQPVTIQVQVSSDIGVPTGTVALTDNSNPLATATLTTSGAASFTITTLAAGTHFIVAKYSGDATFDTSSSPPFNEQVNGAATNTQLTANPNPVQVNHTVTLTATVTSSTGTPSGTINFQNAQGTLGTGTLDSNGQATLATSFASPGNQNIIASYAASGQFAASSAVLTLAVIPRQLTTTSASSFKTIVSPDSLATVFGDNLAAFPVSAGLPPWPMTLGGVSLVFRDNTGTERSAALKFVSSGQINAVVPADMPLGPATAIVRGSGGVDIESGPATIADVAPGLFAGNGTGTGAAAAEVEIVHPDGTTSLLQGFRCDGNGNCTTNPMNLGSDGDQAFLILFGTGIRRGGQSAKVRIAGQDLTPSYAGPQPQLPGVDQVNVLLPVSFRGAGDVTVQIVIGDQLSNVVALTFQ